MSLTANVIRRQDLGFKSHSKDRRRRVPNSCPLVNKASSFTTEASKLKVVLKEEFADKLKFNFDELNELKDDFDDLKGMFEELDELKDELNELKDKLNELKDEMDELKGK